MAQAEAAKAAAHTRDETYAGALQQSRSRKDGAKEKAVGLKQQQAQMSAQSAAAQSQAAQERAQKMTDGQRANALIDRALGLGMTGLNVYGAGQNAGWWGTGKTKETGTDTKGTETKTGASKTPAGGVTYKKGG
jgi:hypothetical protein